MLEDAASGRVRIFDADRRSLVGDLDLALTRTGEHLDATTTPTLHKFKTEQVAHLGEVFGDSERCRAVATAVRDILDQLRRAESAGAAWDDVLAALADGSASSATCALRVAQVAELVRMRGHDWSSMESNLTSAAVNDNLVAGRLVAMAEPASGVSVAWAAFGNAHLAHGYLRVGQVQFFSDQFAPREIRDGCPALLAEPDFEAADELTDEAIEWHFADVQSQSYVLARVEMDGPRAQSPPGGTDPPIAWARRYVSGLVEAAGFRLGGTKWLLLDGGSYFTDCGDRGGSMGFGDPVRRRALESFSPPTAEPTGDALSGLQPAFADALARGEPSAVRAVSDVGWHRGASEIDDQSMRLALRVRTFEAQWVTGPHSQFASWEEAVRHFFRDFWSREAIVRTLFSAASSIELPVHPQRLRDPASSARVAAARNEIFIHHNSRHFSWKPGAVLRLAPGVASDFVADSLPRRQWKELDRVGRRGQSAQQWWREFRCAFDALLNRAVRQRNAIIHGHAVVAEVVASVEPFVGRVSAYLAAQAVDSAARGLSVDDVLGSSRETLATDFERLGSEPSGLALYPE